MRRKNVIPLVPVIASVVWVMFGNPRALVHGEELPRPTVIVAPESTIRGKVILLGEIAHVSAPAPQHAELVARLKGLPLGEIAVPRGRATLPAVLILEEIARAGISPDTIGYSIPKSVTIYRSGRLVDVEEVLRAAREAIHTEKSLDLQVREVTWAEEQLIPVGATSVTVERLGVPRGGKLPIRVDVTVDGEPASRFLATAVVDDWREVPVLGRTVERGRLISPEDIQMVRLNLHKQPDDLVESIDELVGRRVLSTIQAGETVRRKMIQLPPTVAKGKRITMSFGRGGFFATATGIALEDGLMGNIIRVKNESSGKVVRGKVIGPEEVEVGGP